MMHTIFFTLKWALVALILFICAALAYLKWAPIFGGSPDAESRRAMAHSPYFNGQIFHNIIPTEIESSTGEKPSLWKWLVSVLSPPPGKRPGEPLPTMAIDQGLARADGHFTWLGHSTLLFATKGKTILIDPVFYRASPIFFGGASFPMTNPPKIADLPAIDVVLISHDHYDHLDYHAIKEIDAKVGHYYVPLGVKGHLQRWGIAHEKITEFDWYTSLADSGITFTLLPSRHFSGRRLNNRNATLWGAWMVKSQDLSFFFSGDGGYNSGFAQIGKQYGPFDIAFIENGAYDEKWAQIHMLPEESIQAALDLHSSVVVPIHWAKFDLAFHPWKEPIERFTKAAEGKSLRVGTPQIGQTFSLASLPQKRWWIDLQ